MLLHGASIDGLDVKWHALGWIGSGVYVQRRLPPKLGSRLLVVHNVY